MHVRLFSFLVILSGTVLGVSTVLPPEMQDGDPSTSITLAAPCSFTLEHDVPRKTIGLRLVSDANRWINYAPCHLRVFADGVKVAEERCLHPVCCNEPQFIFWPAVTAKVFRVEVVDAGYSAVETLGMYFRWGVRTSLDCWGRPRNRETGAKTLKIAEAELLVEIPDDAPGWNRFPGRAFPRVRQEKDWRLQPEGSITGSKCGDHPNFGIYWQNEKGERELLAYDPEIECSQPVPLRPRRKTIVPRPVARDERSAFGEFYVHDVHYGPGMEGVKRGTAKKLRVVAIENRASFIKTGSMYSPHDPEFCPFISYAGDLSGDALGVGGSSWDVKHVLGEVPINEDGSCYFEAPAATPLYFQLIDAKGRCVQTMRSWATLMPGELQSCIGCHESKLEAPPPMPVKAVRKLRLEAVPGIGRHPLLKRLEDEGRYASVANYMGVQASRSSDPEAPVEGFSYRRIIQPILDRNCVKCHDGSAANRPNLTGAKVKDPRIAAARGNLVDAGRAFTESYFALTKKGRQTEFLNWYSSTGRAQMLPPYAQGAGRSKVMGYLSGAHHGVKATDDELSAFACWIDLAVPFSGSYAEATEWDDDKRWIFEYHQKKREAFAKREMGL